MTQDGTSKDDIRVPDGDLGVQITAGFEDGKDLLITVIAAMGEELVCTYQSLRNPLRMFLQALSFKEAPKGSS